MKPRFIQILIFSFLLIPDAGLQAQPASIFDIELPVLGGGKVSFSDIGKHKATVIVFLAPECPLCENYGKVLRELAVRYEGEGIAFYGIFSGSYYSEAEIRAYLGKFKPQVQVLLDTGFVMQRFLEATVTPEVYLLSPRGEVVYSGKIDNWIAKLGRTRQYTSRHYLADAIAATLSGGSLAVKHTEAIGCLIE